MNVQRSHSPGLAILGMWNDDLVQRYLLREIRTLIGVQNSGGFHFQEFFAGGGTSESAACSGLVQSLVSRQDTTTLRSALDFISAAAAATSCTSCSMLLDQLHDGARTQPVVRSRRTQPASVVASLFCIPRGRMLRASRCGSARRARGAIVLAIRPRARTPVLIPAYRARTPYLSAAAAACIHISRLWDGRRRYGNEVLGQRTGWYGWVATRSWRRVRAPTHWDAVCY